MNNPQHDAIGNLWQQMPGPHLIVTGGPTCEDIDAVRFLSNRSSGRMGIEIAAAGQRAGMATLLILGPTHLPTPEGIHCIHIRSAQQMHDAVLAALPACDTLIMSAAVADYTPVETSSTKMHKEEGALTLTLKRTPDILRAVATHPARAGKYVIGFSLDTEMDLAAGRKKMEYKQLDAIVVNTTHAFGAAASEAILLQATSPSAQSFPLQKKSELAEALIRLAIDKR